MTAELTNPALKDVGFLVGEWIMTLSEASFLPDPSEVLTGRVEVSVIESGGLLALRQHTDPSGPPAATWVIGRDESQPNYTVLYTDARGVARVYEMSFTDDVWRMWRHDPAFSQRFEAAVRPDRQAMAGRWEKRVAGGAWEHDFTLDYRRPAH